MKGCKRLTRLKERRGSGGWKYGNTCDAHHRLPLGGPANRKKIENAKCIRCGWNEAYCDRHRLDPKKGYTKENTVPLCPNCHRLITLKIVFL